MKQVKFQYIIFSCVSLVYFLLFFTYALFSLAGIIVGLYFIFLLIGSLVEIKHDFSKPEENEQVILQLTKEEELSIKVCKISDMSLSDVIPIGMAVYNEMQLKELELDNTGVILYDLTNAELSQVLRDALLDYERNLDIPKNSS